MSSHEELQDEVSAWMRRARELAKQNESLRAQLLAARAEALEEEANATSDMLNALAEDCEKAIAAHRASAFHEFPQTCGGCHWWAGFAGALTEIRFRRQNPEQVMHPAIAALRAKGGGK